MNLTKLLFGSLIICILSVNCGETNSNRLYPIILNNKLGFINQKGELIVEAKYDCNLKRSLWPEVYSDRCQTLISSQFSEGFAIIKLNNKFGFIDQNGKLLIEPQFDYAENFLEGLALVKIANKYGYIDKTGRLVINPVFEDADNFSYGLARVSDGYINKLGKHRIKKTFVDSLVKKSINNAVECELYPFSTDGLAKIRVWTNNGERIFGFINTNGELVIKPQYLIADEFRNGLCVIAVNSKYGCINKIGNMVIEPQYDYLGSFTAGKAFFELNNEYGIINQNAEMVAKADSQLTNVILWKDFREGLATIVFNKKFGYISIDGKIAIEPQFDYADEFKGGLALVEIAGRFGYIDRYGKFIWNPTI